LTGTNIQGYFYFVPQAKGKKKSFMALAPGRADANVLATFL
jgi:hypothetical protein